MKLKEFIRECHQKEVFKNLSIYVVTGWVLIQVFSEIREPFALPKISLTYLLLVLIAGFPFYAYLLWRYRLKPEEQDSERSNHMELDRRNDPSEEEKGHPGQKKHLPGIRFYSPFQKMYFGFLFAILMLSGISVAWIVQANFISEPDIRAFTFPVEEKNDKVAVLSFDNNTMDPDLDVVGKMAVDWIIHGITSNGVAQVISPAVLEQYTTVSQASVISNNDNDILTKYLKPGKVIAGNYYLNDGQLLIQCSIQNGEMNETLETIEPVSCDPASPISCIEQLKQRLLSALLDKDENYTVYEETPPNYEAYKLMLGADEFSNTAPEFLDIMNRAIAIDSNYFEPQMHRITYYYNIDKFATADSLIQELMHADLKNSRQKNLMRLWHAIIRGDNKKAFTYQKKEYDIEPDDLNNNSSTMVLALQFINRPEAVDSIYNTQLAMDKIDSLNCQTCEYRFFSKGMADIAMGKPEKPIEMFGDYGNVKEFYWVKDVLLYAYVRTGNLEEIERILNTVKLTGDEETWREKCLLAAKQLLLKGEKALAHAYLDQIQESIVKQPADLAKEEKELLAYSHFYKGEYVPGGKLFQQLSQEDSDNVDFRAFWAMSLQGNGKSEEAEKTVAGLEDLRADYQYGAIDYAKARYYAFKGDSDLVIQHLIRAVAAGKRYNPGTFGDDVLLQPYKDLEGFRNVLTFWH